MDGTRQRLTQTLVRMVAEHGLDAVSVRQVAAAADVAIGTVQHHFPTKQAMLLAASDAIADAFQARLAAAGTAREPATALRALARQLVPLDAERAAEGRVWLAFVARAAVDAELAAAHRSGWQELEDTITALLAAARDHHTAGAVDRRDAALLLATLDGLAVAGATEPARLPPSRLAALLDHHLDTLLPR